jgi:hypothetical protein
MASEADVRRQERVGEIAELLTGKPSSDVSDLAPARIAKATAAQLQAAARKLEIDLDPKSSKDAWVAAVSEGVLRIATGQTPPGETDAAAAALRSKFDLGPGYAAAPPEHIPWSYGRDRITAMVVDPFTLYCYWEVSDEAISAGRAGLGRGGAEAWLNLRVYDVTGRIFDGTNAHQYADYRVAREDRQWFIHVARPGSVVVVELGMLSSEGYFVKLARSGRAEFPRHATAPTGPIEWLTVTSSSGAVAGAVLGPAAARGGEWVATTGARQGGRAGAVAHAPVEERLWQSITERLWGAQHEVLRREWVEAGRRFEWMGPLVRTTWEAGPFTVPVDVPLSVSERYEGSVMVYTVDGVTRVVFGPWNVVIRGLGGWAEKRVLGTWQVYTSWVVEEGFVKDLQRRSIRPLDLTPGGSERLFEGASELRWILGSEVRLGGASEVYFLGASELRLLGASETMMAGASEVLLRGGSEYRLLGASEWYAGGGSERTWGGGSEMAIGGASEARGGASEQLAVPRLP